MFFTNNFPDLYAVTLCIMFGKRLVLSTTQWNISEFECTLWTL